MAPLILVPERYHWYVSLVPVVHVPALVVSLEPAFAVPLTVGVPVRSVPLAMVPVGAEVGGSSAYPVLFR